MSWRATPTYRRRSGCGPNASTSTATSRWPASWAPGSSAPETPTGRAVCSTFPAPRTASACGFLDLTVLARRSVSIVGARASTRYGEMVASDLAVGLAERAYAVISGAAFGIDGAAHRGALAVDGMTVAVLAGGVDRAYPVAHSQLISTIVETGAVVSEVAPGSAPTRPRFLLRNRLIAAMSAGTVVVEAGLRSGSLNTAGTAEKLGRPVGVVPGPVTSMVPAGCHQASREGMAVLVTDVPEVLDLVELRF